jgi:hypothetical protein
VHEGRVPIQIREAVMMDRNLRAERAAKRNGEEI